MVPGQIFGGAWVGMDVGNGPWQMLNGSRAGLWGGVGWDGCGEWTMADAGMVKLWLTVERDGSTAGDGGVWGLE